MKKYLPVLTIILCSFITADNFATLHQLVGGTWKMKKKDGYTCEKWVKVNGNELKSTAFNIKGKDTSVYESVSLTNKNGVIAYTVTGAGNSQPVAFKLTTVNNNQFIFSNPAHDFPQQVVYQFINPDSIHAWVDGKYNGKVEKIDFYYKRTK
ncbi:DUF6265 family protein [Mucilaginibacter auburnensis]|uniref:DUF6265 domain-containing protein n=1 Tax=Mucilaginibacter auburnensis TaxID=1457233 RepID=A0A2H9VLG3_9SPHI|nr:DUF6265 family protein [Mucilaginibacter auburnensis]PJJ79188.1 hypothetical protein CLV57_2313 [Mucilaginibacter auburnensis]